MSYNIYWDTSAFVKLFLKEDDSGTVRTYIDNSNLHFASQLIFSESLSAFWFQHRCGSYTRDRLSEIISVFNESLANLTLVDLTEELSPYVEEIISKFPLKGADLVNVASAIRLTEDVPDLLFASFDLQQRNAAITCGLKLLFE